jgi:hypothetical protein
MSKNGLSEFSIEKLLRENLMTSNRRKEFRKKKKENKQERKP